MSPQKFQLLISILRFLLSGKLRRDLTVTQLNTTNFHSESLEPFRAWNVDNRIWKFSQRCRKILGKVTLQGVWYKEQSKKRNERCFEKGNPIDMLAKLPSGVTNRVSFEIKWDRGIWVFRAINMAGFFVFSLSKCANNLIVLWWPVSVSSAVTEFFHIL